MESVRYRNEQSDRDDDDDGETAPWLLSPLNRDLLNRLRLLGLGWSNFSFSCWRLLFQCGHLPFSVDDSCVGAHAYSSASRSVCAAGSFFPLPWINAKTLGTKS